MRIQNAASPGKSAQTVRQDARYLVLVLALGLISRLWFTWKHPTLVFWGQDMVHYDHAARMVLFHHIYSYWGTEPDAFVTPGFPLFLAACYWVASHLSPSPLAWLRFTYLVQGLLAGIECGLLYIIARFALSRGPAFLVSLLWLGYYPALWSASLPLTEALFVFALIAFTASWLYALARPTAWTWAVTGLLLAFATLVRPMTLPLIVLTLWTALRTKRGNHSRRRALAMGLWHAAGFLILMLPWWIRNALVLHRLLLTDDDAANPLLFGSFPNMQVPPDFHLAADQKAQAIQRITDGFTHQPWTYLRWYTVGKLEYLFSQPWMPAGAPSWLTHGEWALHLCLLVAGSIGLVLAAWRRYARLWLLLAAYLVLVLLPFLPLPRYAFPTIPFFCLGAGVLMERIWHAAQRRRPATDRGAVNA